MWFTGKPSYHGQLFFSAGYFKSLCINMTSTNPQVSYLHGTTADTRDTTHWQWCWGIHQANRHNCQKSCCTQGLWIENVKYGWDLSMSLSWSGLSHRIQYVFEVQAAGDHYGICAHDGVSSWLQSKVYRWPSAYSTPFIFSTKDVRCRLLVHGQADVPMCKVVYLLSSIPDNSLLYTSADWKGVWVVWFCAVWEAAFPKVGASIPQANRL